MSWEKAWVASPGDLSARKLEVPDFDPRDLRNALGRFATGVCLVTTQGVDGKREGLTANSFSSVSLEPPIVLWSLRRGAGSLATFIAAEHFCINVLHAEQIDISRHFCRPQLDKFEEVAEAFGTGIGGLPTLKGALATFECERVSHQVVGDHVVFYGLVRRYTYSDASPLAFHAGNYACLQSA
ncbi:flavin reductase family protein [Cupriavidus necator]